jgi:hypothetical protein
MNFQPLLRPMAILNMRFVFSLILRSSLTADFSRQIMAGAGEYNYERIALLLKKINLTLVTLERYVLVKKIDEVKRLYALTKATIRRKIFSSFREIGQVSLCHSLCRSLLTLSSLSSFDLLI